MEQTNDRPTWSDIRLDHLQHNVRQFKQHLDETTHLMAVVKADGYGHGAVPSAKAALEAGADYLAVALLEEGLELRKAGIESPILLLSPIEKNSVKKAVLNNLSLTVYTQEIAAETVRIKKEYAKTVPVHLKIDTGMNRIGVRTKEEAAGILYTLQQGGIDAEGIFTHFADADNLSDSSFTYQQYQNFMEIVQYCEDQGYQFDLRHCCNTAATMAYPELQLDMVRVGIGLYGLFPSVEFSGMLDLRPVMSFKTSIAFLKTISSGQTVGYNRTFEANKKMKIATIPVGYADGYPRQISNKGFASFNGKRVPVTGLVCMDQTMLDLSFFPEAIPGQEVILFGSSEESAVTAYDLADWAGTTHYAIVCEVSKRVPRIYHF